VGQWYMGKKQGYGRYIFSNGDMYDGDWMRDMAHGKGFYRYALDIRMMMVMMMMMMMMMMMVIKTHKDLDPCHLWYDVRLDA
jgi:hypothetical protein